MHQGAQLPGGAYFQNGVLLQGRYNHLPGTIYPQAIGGAGAPDCFHGRFQAGIAATVNKRRRQDGVQRIGHERHVVQRLRGLVKGDAIAVYHIGKSVAIGRKAAAAGLRGAVAVQHAFALACGQVQHHNAALAAIGEVGIIAGAADADIVEIAIGANDADGNGIGAQVLLAFGIEQVYAAAATQHALEKRVHGIDHPEAARIVGHYRLYAYKLIGPDAIAEAPAVPAGIGPGLGAAAQQFAHVHGHAISPVGVAHIQGIGLLVDADARPLLLALGDEHQRLAGRRSAGLPAEAGEEEGGENKKAVS